MGTIVTPPPEIPRDRYGRPMVVPPTGTKPVAYTRATTFIDCLDDKYNLQQWERRMVALGLATRPDLLLRVSSIGVPGADKAKKKQLDEVCSAAKEAAAASAAATTGTALHALTELIDRGQELPVIPVNAMASLNAYRAATANLTATHIEQFCVLDKLRIGGTPDRVVRYQGNRYIADVKTGSIEYGVLKIAMQLAIYARSHTYDIATGVRGEHGADTLRGIIIHLPAVEDPADARCDLHWVDLKAGWEAVLVARQVRDKRTLKFADLTQPFGAAELPIEGPLEQPSLADQIRACTTADDVRALWAVHAAEWTDELTAVASAHITSLPTAS